MIFRSLELSFNRTVIPRNLHFWERKWCVTFAPGRENGMEHALPCAEIVVGTNCTPGEQELKQLKSSNHSAPVDHRDHKTSVTIHDALKLVGLHVCCCRCHTHFAYRPIVKQYCAGIKGAGIKGCRRAALIIVHRVLHQQDTWATMCVVLTAYCLIVATLLCLMQVKVPRNKSTTSFSLHGTKVPRSESSTYWTIASGSEITWEQRFHNSLHSWLKSP